MLQSSVVLHHSFQLKHLQHKHQAHTCKEDTRQCTCDNKSSATPTQYITPEQEVEAKYERDSATA